MSESDREEMTAATTPPRRKPCDCAAYRGKGVTCHLQCTGPDDDGRGYDDSIDRVLDSPVRGQAASINRLNRREYVRD